MKLKELLKERQALESDARAILKRLEPVNARLTEIKIEIEEIIADPVRQARELAAKTTGTVDVLVQGVMVKHAVQKTVKWDQGKLAEIRQRVIDGNDNPDAYMDSNTTYKINEKQFKAFPPEIKAVFVGAREVKPGAPTITFDLNWRNSLAMPGK